VRLIGAVVCPLAANRGSQLFADAGNGWPHSALRYIISSSAATSEIVKRFWPRTHVRSAITSIATFAFYPLCGASNEPIVDFSDIATDHGNVEPGSG